MDDDAATDKAVVVAAVVEEPNASATTNKRPSPNKDDVTQGPDTKRAMVSPEEKKDEVVAVGACY